MSYPTRRRPSDEVLARMATPAGMVIDRGALTQRQAQAAAQTMRLARAAQDEADALSAAHPAAMIETTQWGGERVVVPFSSVTATAIPSCDELVTWNRCGADVDIAEGAAEVVIASIRWRRAGRVLWMRAGTYAGTPAALAAALVRIETSAGQNNLTTDGQAAAPIPLAALMGASGDAFVPLMRPVRENEQWTVFGSNQAPSGSTALQLWGSFGFKWDLG